MESLVDYSLCKPALKLSVLCQIIKEKYTQLGSILYSGLEIFFSIQISHDICLRLSVVALQPQKVKLRRLPAQRQLKALVAKGRSAS